MVQLHADFFKLTSRLSLLPVTGLSSDDLFSELSRLSARMSKEIPSILKALLVADGTVTLLLEAYFGEPINVVSLGQEELTLAQAIPSMALNADAEVFYRKVELVGNDSGRVYARAQTLLNTSLIETGLFKSLVAEDVGIGTVLRNSGRGSFREVLCLGVDESSDQRSYQNSDVASGVVDRSYLVRLDGKPALLISEAFPLISYGQAG